MKKYLILLLTTFTVFLSACPNPGGGGNGNNNGNDDPPQGEKTRVYFVNNNNFAVTVYSDYSRLVKFAGVGPKRESEPVETTPNPGAVFYPSYHLLIDGLEFLYNSSGLAARIDAEKTTRVPVPLLSELEPSELAKPVTSGVYIKIQNAGTFPLSLRRGNYEEIPQGMNSSIINSGETAQYALVTGGPVSNYSFMRNTVTPIPFPADLTAFVSGRVYSFFYDGSQLSLLADRPLTIAQALATPPPEGLAITGQTVESISLSWQAVPGAVGYKIYKGLNSDNVNEYTGETSSTSYTVTGLALNTGYYFAVSTVNGSGESPPSAAVRGTTSEMMLETPAGLKVAARTQTSLTLSWQAVSGAEGYRISRSAGSGNSYDPPQMTASPAYTDTGLTPGAVYYYKVAAYSGRSESNAAIISGTTLSGDGTIPLPPAKPSGLVVSGVEPGSVSLSWNSVTNADSYDVYRADSEDGAPVKTGTVTETSWTDYTVSAGTLYYYSVRAVNSSGSSSASNRVFACAASHYNLSTYSSSQLMNLPAGVKHYYRLTVSTGQSYTLTWQDGSGQNTGWNVRCTAWQNDGTEIFRDAYYGYTSPKVFTAATTGYVTVEVKNTSGSTGYDYQIYYY